MPTERGEAGEKDRASGASAAGKKPRRRHWYEAAAIAVVLIVAVAGGYYGFYVTKRSDQLSEHYSRNLAVAATIVREAIEGAWLHVCNTGFDRDRLAMIAGMELPPPDEWTTPAKEDSEPADDASHCDKLPSLRTLAGFDRGAATLEFRHDQKFARLPLPRLLGPALPDSDFDSVLLARTDGRVLFRLGGKGLNIVRLPIEQKPTPAGRDADALGEAPDAPHGWYTTVTEIEVAGTRYKLFTQPLRLPINLRWRERRNADGTTGGRQNENVWVLAGLKSNGNFVTEAMAISPTILVAAFGVAVVALLALPYLKLRFLGRRDALHSHDLLVLTSALSIGTTIATFAVLETYARVSFGEAIDSRLKALSADISTAFHQEVACLDEQLRRLTAEHDPEHEHDAESESDPDPDPDPEHDPTRTRLLAREGEDDLLDAYPFIEMAYWVQRDGWQTSKWTVQDRTTALIPLDTRDYFIAARDLRFETKNAGDCPRTADSSGPDPTYTKKGYYLESIRSRTTGVVSTVLAQRVDDRAFGQIRTANEQPDEQPDEQPIVVAAALAPLLSVIEPTLPPGFEFAVIDVNGEIMLHSDSTRNLRENFFNELSNSLELRAAVWSRTTRPVRPPPASSPGDAAGYPLEPMDVEYRARPYRAHLTRLEGTAWTLVSLYDVSAYHIARAEVLTFALAMSLIYTVLLLGVFGVLHVARAGRDRVRGSLFHWMWPSADQRDTYVGILVFAAAVSLIWLLLQIFVSSALSVLLSALLGLATFLVCFETLRQEASGSKRRSRLARIGADTLGRLAARWPALASRHRERSEPSVAPQDDDARIQIPHRLYASCIMAVMVVLSVLPPIAFYRAANDEIMALFVMGDQLRWADRIHARSDRVAKRYNGVSMSDDAHKEIRGHLFPVLRGLGESWDMHPAGWRVCLSKACTGSWYGKTADDRGHPDEAGGDDCGGLHPDDRCFFQPIAAMLGPELPGIVRESWEIRSIANEENRRWHRHGPDIVFVDKTLSEVPGLGLEPEPRQDDAPGPGAESEPEQNEAAGSEAGQNEAAGSEQDGRRPRLPESLSDDAALYLASPWPGLALPGMDGRWLWVAMLVGAAGLALWVAIRKTVRLVFLTELRAPVFLPIRDWADLDGCRRALVLRSSLDNEPRADSKRVFRIRAAQGLDAADIEKPGEQPETAASAAAATIIVEDFHSGLWDPTVAKQRLALLEKLLALDCRVVVHSEVNPLHYFTMVAGDHFRGATEVRPELGRWAAALAPFVRCRNVPRKSAATRRVYKRLIDARKGIRGTRAIGQAERKILKCLAAECWPNEHLEKIAMDLARREDLRELVVDGDDERLVKQVLDLAESHYRMLWSISGKDERMILYRLARNGFVSWRARELVRRLLHRGLIYLDRGPTLMNESFRQFVLGAELPEVFEVWTREEGVTPWARLRTPLIAMVVGIFLFLFATQPQLFRQSLAFTTAIVAVVPTFIKLLSLVGTRQGSANYGG